MPAIAKKSEARRLLDADKLYEVVGGKVVETPRMGAKETRLATMLSHLILSFSLPNNLGEAVTETLFVLNRKKRLQRRPDVAYISYKRWPKGRDVPRGEAWDVVPNIAVEVVSPSNTANEIIDKIGDYFDAKCQSVWVVYPITEQIYVYESPSETDIYGRGEAVPGEPALPGFQLDVAKLFDM
jgi:Uma2 family endonuclease